MNIDTYRQALRYAIYVEWRIPRDIVHDAYLLWYDQTGKDLFDEPPRLVTAIVKTALRRTYSASKRVYQWNLEKHHRVWIPIKEDPTYEGEGYTPVSVMVDSMDADRFRKKLSRILTSKQKDVLKHITLGYTATEIARKNGVSSQAVFEVQGVIRKNAIKLGINKN